jgi:hypothetical protein
MARACLALTLLMLWGCASPPASHTLPAARPLDDVQRIAIVPSGDSSFTVAQQRGEPGRTIDEILKWHPWGAALRPIAKLVHRAINSVRDVERAGDAARNVDDISPGSIVARAMAQALASAGKFADVRALEQEPSGEGQPFNAAVVRVIVSAWGITQVRQEDRDLVAGFADVRADMAMEGTGVALWTDSEDVTHPESAPLGSFVRDRAFAREVMVEVLERAGQRLASELLYARSVGR